ncbi:hypothetical protein SNE40_001436 [Patella caerulea]|uniref:arylamine N-acetyltransferase n=1 Tax=Patella caerulea TaxID=87958 RepID=A0AAN8QI21_PATCE
MLSKKEAISFLTEILQLNNVNELLDSSNNFDIINTIMRSYREKEPFQNITLLATDPADRHRPTWTEIKQDMFLRKGGLCYSHHIFLYALLKALNFDVSMARSSVWPLHSNNHLVIFVKNVEQNGDLFLLEAACANPTFKIISLDFEEESPVFFESFLEYKFVKRDGHVLRMHRKGDIRPPSDKDPGVFEGEWRRFYDLDLQEVESVHDFDVVFEDVYTNPELTPFHRSLLFVLFKDQKTQILANNKSLIENNQHQLETNQFKSDEELLKCLNSLTEAFDVSSVRKALDNWRKTKAIITK